jgi:hypothetical protein
MFNNVKETKHSEQETKIEQITKTSSWSSTSCGENELCDSSISSEISSSCDSSSRDAFETEASDSDSQTHTQEISSCVSFLTTSLQQTTIESEGFCSSVRRRLSEALEAERRSSLEEDDNSSLSDSINQQKLSLSLSNLDDLYPNNSHHDISTSGRASFSCISFEIKPYSPRLASTLSPRYTRKTSLSLTSTPHCKVKRCPLPIFGNNTKGSECDVFVGLSPCKKMQKIKSQTLLPCIRGSHPELNCISGETVPIKHFVPLLLAVSIPMHQFSIILVISTVN